MELNHANHTRNSCKASYTEVPTNPVRPASLPEMERKVKPDALPHVIFTKAVCDGNHYFYFTTEKIKPRESKKFTQRHTASEWGRV